MATDTFGKKILLRGIMCPLFNNNNHDFHEFYARVMNPFKLVVKSISP